MPDREEARKFEQSLLGWLDDAYNLARWLVHDDQEAQDAVQDAFLRAMRYAGGFRGGNRRAWLLAIVRNACFSWLRANRPADLAATTEDRPEEPSPAEGGSGQPVGPCSDGAGRWRSHQGSG